MTDLRRRGTALVIIAAIAGGAGCASETGAEQSRAPGEPPVTVTPGEIDLKRLTLPLDAYRFGPDDMPIVSKARSILLFRCMRRFGFDRKALAETERPVLGYARRYGLLDENAAAAYGYHPPSREDLHARAKVAELTPAEEEVLMGRGAAAQRRGPIPEGGCAAEADRNLAIGARAPDNPELVEQLALDSIHRAEADSRVRAAFDQWSRCMQRAGYDYRSPWEANDDVAFQSTRPTKREIATATADVACKRQVDLVQIWAAVEVVYQRAAIARSANQLAVVRRQLDTMLANARHVVHGDRAP